MAIKTILFDLDYTLVKTGDFKELSKSASIMRMQAEAMNKFRLKIPRKLLEESIETIRKEKTSNYDKILDEAAASVCRSLGLTEQTHIDMISTAGISGHHMIKDAYFAFLYEEVVETLHSLKEAGLQICLATAGKTHKQIDKVEWAYLTNDIDLVFVTQQYIQETGTVQTIDMKSKEFFQWILKKIKCEPNEVIMVGDSYPNDIENSKNAGIWTVHLSRKCSGEKVKGEKADYLVEDLTSIPKIVEELNARGHSQ